MNKTKVKAKVVIIGDIGVGKTSLLHRFVDDLPLHHPAHSIQCDFKMRTVVVDGSPMQLEVWDTAGQERFESLTAKFFRGCHGVLLVYDVTNRQSLIGLQRWVDEMTYLGIPVWKSVLVGNKTDLRSKCQVENEQAASFAGRLCIPAYVETSVKENMNVEQAFLTLARQMMQQMNRETALKPATNRSSFDLLEGSENNRKEYKKFKNHCCK